MALWMLLSPQDQEQRGHFGHDSFRPMNLRVTARAEGDHQTKYRLPWYPVMNNDRALISTPMHQRHGSGTHRAENERRFVKELDKGVEVEVYAKLSKSFFIPTPVGNYSPDWAIAFKVENEHELVKDLRNLLGHRLHTAANWQTVYSKDDRAKWTLLKAIGPRCFGQSEVQQLSLIESSGGYASSSLCHFP